MGSSKHQRVNKGEGSVAANKTKSHKGGGNTAGGKASETIKGKTVRDGNVYLEKWEGGIDVANDGILVKRMQEAIVTKGKWIKTLQTQLSELNSLSEEIEAKMTEKLTMIQELDSEIKLMYDLIGMTEPNGEVEAMGTEEFKLQMQIDEEKFLNDVVDIETDVDVDEVMRDIQQSATAGEQITPENVGMIPDEQQTAVSEETTSAFLSVEGSVEVIRPEENGVVKEKIEAVAVFDEEDLF